jgi:ABC-type Fe3+-hydroxamate transport system substrate-binding protein
MRRTLTLILGVALFGILAAVVVASQGADDPASTETVTDTVERTTTVEDNPARRGADDDGVA